MAREVSTDMMQFVSQHGEGVASYQTQPGIYGRNSCPVVPGWDSAGRRDHGTQLGPLAGWPVSRRRWGAAWAGGCWSWWTRPGLGAGLAWDESGGVAEGGGWAERRDWWPDWPAIGAVGGAGRGGAGLDLGAGPGLEGRNWSGSGVKGPGPNPSGFPTLRLG